ncbi:MAG TPA: hypothetical protein VKE74_10465 [Gemmataceae bacterium]|nr:hypothetical protein [Gemmataceae bacterium]
MSSRGADRVQIGGAVVYAVFVQLGQALRLRLSADEWERLGVPIGARVDIAAQGLSMAAFFVASATYVDPGWQWVECVPAPTSARRVTRTGSGALGRWPGRSNGLRLV